MRDDKSIRTKELRPRKRPSTIQKTAISELQDYDWLYERYVVKFMTSTEIAEEANCGFGVVCKWLTRHNITKSLREEGMKRCGGCGIVKSLSEFHRSNGVRSSGFVSTCKSCRATYQKEYVKRDPRRAREMKMRSKYNLAVGEYDQLLANQGNVCAICCQPFDQSIPKLMEAVDHCHSSGRVRGILHRVCNSALGLLDDNPERCLRAVEYLKTTEERTEQ